MADGETPEAPSTLKGVSAVQLLIMSLNTLTILGAAGFLFYSKFLFQKERPTEENERDRLKTAFKRGDPDENTKLMYWDPLVLNIHDSNNALQEGNKKYRYVTMGMVLELRDASKEEMIRELRPFIIDKIIALVSKKHLADLTSVQGRYILVAQMIELIQQVISQKATNPPKAAVVNHIYFTEFYVN
jgi:flagellar basal body-associated protein FliL